MMALTGNCAFHVKVIGSLLALDSKGWKSLLPKGYFVPGMKWIDGFGPEL